jgi:hypothetical protein
LFYHNAFAIHGAYWHDIFGNKKSHGCTNVAPADARWLFYWSEPKLPEPWHSIRARSDNSTGVYITTDALPETDTESPSRKIVSAG